MEPQGPGNCRQLGLEGLQKQIVAEKSEVSSPCRNKTECHEKCFGQSSELKLLSNF